VAALGATKPVGVDGAVPGSVMPFVPTGEVPTEALPVLAPPKLSLEQYASLCAEWQAAPARQRETLAKYGLSDAYSKTLLDVEWSRRLEQERALGQRFEQLVEQYLAWLNARR
jgi:hypothetical protein